MLVLALSPCVVSTASAEGPSEPSEPMSLEVQSQLTRDAAAAVLAYQTMETQDPSLGAPAPAPYEQQTERKFRPNRPLMTTSAAAFLASYVPTIITAAANKSQTSNNLYIPIAGPWMEIAREPTSGANKALLSLSGIFQSLGTIGMISSFFVPETRTRKWYLMGNRRFHFAPTAGRGTYGMSAQGRF
jgi:hypothetical protein